MYMCFLKFFKSDEICQGKFPSLPITRFLSIAAIIDSFIIIILKNLYGIYQTAIGAVIFGCD